VLPTDIVDKRLLVGALGTPSPPIYGAYFGTG